MLSVMRRDISPGLALVSGVSSQLVHCSSFHVPPLRLDPIAIALSFFRAFFGLQHYLVYGTGSLYASSSYHLITKISIVRDHDRACSDRIYH